MIRTSLAVIFLVLSTFSFSAENKTEGKEQIEEFKSANFLQVDPFEIPSELKVIENQISQNAIDVIILTGKYTVSYSEKRPEGYNKNYKNFFGVRISIYPVSKESTEYSLKLHYYNWVTNKYDKVITKRISKYNVLNEMRFAMYDLILGSDFVRENRDTLERKNFERIQAVREMVEDQARREKKKKKEDQELAEKKKMEKAQKKAEPEEKLKREERKKKSSQKEEEEPEDAEAEKRSLKEGETSQNKAPEEETEELQMKKNPLSSAKSAKKKELEKKLNEAKNEKFAIDAGEVQPEMPAIEPPTPKTITFNLNSGLRFETVDANGLIQARTNLTYLNLGADYRADFQAKYPWGYGFSLNAGIPVKKEKYQISVSRALEGWAFKTFFSRLRIGAGVEYSSLIFANLPSAGEGIKIVQNDLLYGKLKFSIHFNVYDKEMSLGAEYGSSLSQKSNFNKAISVTKDAVFFQTQIKGDHGAAVKFFQSTFTGEFTGKSSGAAILYVYNFGN